MNEDTEKLLKECDAGSKTAVNSIKEVLDNVKSTKLISVLTSSVEMHEKIGNEIHKMLSNDGKEGKEPNAMARAMSWMKINAKMITEPTDKTIADLMTDGCNMGIKQLSSYKNQYSSAENEAVKFADKLIKEEEKLLKELKEFL